MADATHPVQDAAQAVLAELGAADVSAIRLRVHDASHVEWVIALPLPQERRLAYEIDVELEVPASAATREAPWDLLQVFTRLDGPAAIASSSDLTIDQLRRGTVALTRMLDRAKEGFTRHCRSAATAQAVPDLSGQPFLTVWLEAALRSVREARRRLTGAGPQDPALIAKERELIDEFVSVRLLDLLFEADRLARDSGAAATAPAVRAAFEALAARIDEVLREEMTYRESHGFLRADTAAPEALERYLARAARLKKHFEEVLFLDRESKQLDERVQLWTRVAGALVGGIVATIPLQLILARRPVAGDIGWGVLALALLTGLAYAAREHIKESGQSWLTGKMARFQTQRLSRCRVPARRLPTRDVVVEAREWCRQLTVARPDPLNPEGGASLRVMQVHYIHHGRIRPQADLWSAGVRRVLHIFRYDLSPLLPRMDDEPKPVPVMDQGGRVAFVAAARPYHVPITIRVEVAGERLEQRGTLVLDRAGVRRLSLGVEEHEV
jgi:hypothetical protein